MDVSDINAIKIEPATLWQLAADAEKYNRRHPDAESFSAWMHLIARRVKRGDVRRALAIFCRMRALCELIEAEGVTGWTLPKQPDGSVLTQEAVFMAAAIHPLVERDGECVFDKESFLQLVLEVVEPETTA